jgi:hypothetical protein
MKKNERFLLLMEDISDEMLVQASESLETASPKPVNTHRHFPWKRAVIAACLCLIIFACTPVGRTLAVEAREGLYSIWERLFPPKEVSVSLEGEQETSVYVPYIEIEEENIRQEETPEFVIYIDDELYETDEEGDTLIIRPKGSLENSGLSECSIKITKRSGISLEDATKQMQEELSENYALHSEPETSTQPKGNYFTASNGTSWDDEQVEVYLVDDEQGNVFVIFERYFMEATEGHGSRFKAMIQTFELVNEHSLQAES